MSIPSGASSSDCRRRRGPIVIGPWVGEVGFELLYWIPFLNCALRTYRLEIRRLIVVSRGGARATGIAISPASTWTCSACSRSTSIDRRTRRAGARRDTRSSTASSRWTCDIFERAKEKAGLQQAELLHPSLMYRILRFYWFEKAGIGLLNHHTDYRRLSPVERSSALKDLPADYVAVRFYFRPSFPDTPENQRFAAHVIRSLSQEIPVVLLNTGLRLDDHEDLSVPGKNVYRVDELMRLEQNLEIQTEIISNARAFVGTYGGLAYVGPFYGVPSISFYSTEDELIPAHIDVSWRLGRTMGVAMTTLHTQTAGLLRTLFSEVLGPRPQTPRST